MTFKSHELKLLMQYYIQTDEMCDNQELMVIHFWETLAELYNNDVGCQVRRTAQEVRTAYENFTRACTRYTKIINEVISENVFENTRSTYDGRYNLKYRTPFIGHDAYFIRQNWLERFGWP